MSAQHSQGRWVLVDAGSPNWSIWAESGRFVCAQSENLIEEAKEEAAANGPYIVQCVNAHDALYEALANIVLLDENDRTLGCTHYQKGSMAWKCWQAARAALKAAGGAP